MIFKPKRAVLVTGSRSLPGACYDLVAKKLDEADPDLVIHGEATGADSFADEWARVVLLNDYHDAERCAVRSIPYFGQLGRAGGHKRNAVLVQLAEAYLYAGAHVQALAFPTRGSRGTPGCIALVERASIPWRAWAPDGTELAPKSLLDRIAALTEWCRTTEAA